jgi:hypothetical protein
VKSKSTMSIPAKSSHHPRIFIFTHPRTASNLFMRLFECHPDLSITSYTFKDAFYCGPEPLLCRCSLPRNPQSSAPDATYQSRFNQLQQFIADAEAAGKIPFIKEHLYFITDPQTVAAHVICLPNGTPRILSAKPVIKDSTSSLSKPLTLPENPTLLSNNFLTTLSPVILIRHPAKIIPSFYRASRATAGATVLTKTFL